MPMSVGEIAMRARDQLVGLTGLQAGTVSSLAHKEDGWHIIVDMIELKRIPESSDILATYEVVLDEKGNLMSYERTQRYYRGQVEGKVQ
ncbi:MAG: gas vesicle protein [Chloroflexia bacterium]|nr:gas vesicle protein [Chloroflexia bacterium]